jgi:hypothetical protein
VSKLTAKQAAYVAQKRWGGNGFAWGGGCKRTPKARRCDCPTHPRTCAGGVKFYLVGVGREASSGPSWEDAFASAENHPRLPGGARAKIAAFLRDPRRRRRPTDNQLSWLLYQTVEGVLDHTISLAQSTAVNRVLTRAPPVWNEFAESLAKALSLDL